MADADPLKDEIEGKVCPFCKGDPEALADAHSEGWRAGREEGRRESEASDIGRLAEALSRAAHWLMALADAGPDLRINAHLKAAHEAQELADDPSPLEAADVLICVVGTALHHGWTVDDLANAVAHKVRINAARTWTQKADGTWQHNPVEALRERLNRPAPTTGREADDA